MTKLNLGYLKVPVYITRHLTPHTPHPPKIMAKRTREPQRKQFCFTYNNYTAEGEANLKKYLEANCKYAVYGHEVGESGTPHLQGYFSLKKQARMATIHGVLSGLGIKMALLVARGTAADNKTYCEKDGTDLYEFGELKAAQAGNRTDLHQVCDDLKTKSINEVAMEHPTTFVHYSRGIKELKFQMTKNDYGTKPRPMHTTVYYGDGGLGKTRSAREDSVAAGKRVYMVPYPNGHQIWFDGYDGEEVIIFDDFKGWIRPQELFRFLDMYPLQLAIKGGYTWAAYTQVFITSNHPISDWYSNEVMAKINAQAYERRFHKIVFFMKERGEILKIVEKDIPGFIPDPDLTTTTTTTTTHSLNVIPPGSPDLRDEEE